MCLSLWGSCVWHYGVGSMFTLHDRIFSKINGICIIGEKNSVMCIEYNLVLYSLLVVFIFILVICMM